MPTSPSGLSPSAGLAVVAPHDEAPAPAPVPLTVKIVGSVGSFAFVPNPLTAVVGDTLVWLNDDVVPHQILLEDGTDLGLLMPGQSSVPVALAAPSTGYHCAFHASMVGAINRPLPDEGAGDPYYPDPYYPGYGGRRR